MLADLNLGDGNNVGTVNGRIALDCSVRQIPRRRRPGDREDDRTWYTISTTDFFFPLVDSPYAQGRIGAANVLSDLFAQGVADCDFVLMLLAACRGMPEPDRTICTKEMVRGFRDACQEAGTVVTGGQTVLNPWPIIGGVATSVVPEGDFVFSDGALVGNVVVLTKPLGTQVAVNVRQWQKEYQRNPEDTKNGKFWKKILDDNVISLDVAQDLFHHAVCSMARLNQHGARLMTVHGATAATDVTGFGLLGHAQNLVDNQKEAVGMELHTLPCLTGAVPVNNQVLDFGLLTGYSAETSGGLLVVLPNEESAQAYCQELQQVDKESNCPAWIVGRIVADPNRKAFFQQSMEILNV
ncbi:hypothetical protein ACA910_013191 [Epithemia clementina (nom. ined.)]